MGKFRRKKLKKKDDSEMELSEVQFTGRKEMLQKQIEDDDFEIKKLEKLLKFNRRKNKKKIPQSLIDMGLGEIIETCDLIESSRLKQSGAAANTAQSEDEEEEEHSEDEEDEEEYEDEEEDEEEEMEDAESASECEEEVEDIHEEAAEVDSAEVATVQQRLSIPVQQVTVETLARAGKAVEEQLASRSTAVVKQAFLRQLMSCCAAPSATPVFLQDVSALLALLHVQHGVQISASLLEEVVLRTHAAAEENRTEDAAEAGRLMLMLAHLYQFGVCESKLVLDLMLRRANRLDILDVDVLIDTLKAVGFSLRKDDPVKLKQFIATLQESASKTDSTDIPRLHLLMNTHLQAIVNNNHRKLPDYDPSHSEQLKKLLSSLRHNKRSRAAPLGCDLQDILTADQCGRWWLVGSAWTEKNTENQVKPRDSEKEVDDKIRKLAEELEIGNSAHRLRILDAVVGAESPDTAFIRVQKLNLSRVHERDLIPVLLICLLGGKKFNPFFSELIATFCQFHRRFKMSLRCALWDQFTAVQQTKVRPRVVAHLGRALAGWLLEATVAWPTLKRCPLEAAVTDGQTRQLVVHLLHWLLRELGDSISEMLSTCDSKLRKRLRRALRSCSLPATKMLKKEGVKLDVARQSLRKLLDALTDENQPNSHSDALNLN